MRFSVMMFAWVLPLAAWGGNPSVTEAGSFRFWDEENQTVFYHLERANEGNISDELIQQLAVKAFEQWSSIKYSELKFEFGGFLETDVTPENFEDFINNSEDSLNPVIFDFDGAILDTMFGQGSSESILGLTSAISGSGNGRLQTASIIINGKLLFDSEDFASRAFSTLLHEAGHFAGLGHTQIHTEFAFDDNINNDLFIPVMFPFEAESIDSTLQLSPDDELTLASLYRNDLFFTDLGCIIGSVVRKDGTAVQGANVVAVNIDKQLVSRFAVVSDLNKTQTGEFEFAGLPPGQYELFIEPVNPAFTGISAVGPFANTSNSPSFTNPVTKEYYNGENESGFASEDDPMDKVILEVRAGETLPPIQIIANEPQTPVNLWELF